MLLLFLNHVFLTCHLVLIFIRFLRVFLVLRMSHQAGLSSCTMYTIEGNAVMICYCQALGDLPVPVLIEVRTGKAYFPLLFNGITLIAFT